MPFTTAGAASALGMKVVTATPSAQKVAAPSTTTIARAAAACAGNDEAVEGHADSEGEADEQLRLVVTQLSTVADHVGPRRKRRAADPLQDALLPLGGEGDREVRVAGGDDAEGHDPRDEVLVELESRR